MSVLVEPPHFVERLFALPSPGFSPKPSSGNMSSALTFLPLTVLTYHHTGPLSERRLMDVRLGELTAWLGTRDFSPQGLLGGVQKGEVKSLALEAELAHLAGGLTAAWAKWPVCVSVKK